MRKVLKDLLLRNGTVSEKDFHTPQYFSAHIISILQQKMQASVQDKYFMIMFEIFYHVESWKRWRPSCEPNGSVGGI